MLMGLSVSFAHTHLRGGTLRKDITSTGRDDLRRERGREREREGGGGWGRVEGGGWGDGGREELYR